jgi:hypothetical protein
MSPQIEARDPALLRLLVPGSGPSGFAIIDRRHFETYRVRRGHRHYPIEIFP